jgi:hypothetical protein
MEPPEVRKLVLVLRVDDPDWTVGEWWGDHWWIADFQVGGVRYEPENVIKWRELPPTEEAA